LYLSYNKDGLLVKGFEGFLTSELFFTYISLFLLKNGLYGTQETSPNSCYFYLGKSIYTMYETETLHDFKLRVYNKLRKTGFEITFKEMSVHTGSGDR